METNDNAITLQFASPEDAQTFISTVRHDEQFSKKVNFLLSIGQRFELRKIRQAAKRPNETPLNFKAFMIVAASGLILWFVCAFFGARITTISLSTVALGIAVATLSGAFAALGLPSRSSTNRLMHIRVRCDSGIRNSFMSFADKHRVVQ